MADADTVLWYERNASALCNQYESASSDEIHSVLNRWIQSGMHVLELGCGSGRDARFMASLGADVVATDASAQMLGEARARAGRVTFRQLAMPPAEKDLREAGIVSGADSRPPFDAVVSIAMIMHLTDAELFATAKAIDRLVTDEGLVILSFCPSHPQNDARRYESRTAQSVRLLMEDFGFSCAEHRQTGDGLGRDIAWHTMVFVRNAAPRTARKHLQSVIFADEKTATYKLALLRSLCEISQGSAAHLRFEGESRVSIPLGLVIEKWIEYYWPLLDLPQLGGGRRMGFETELRALVQLFGRSGYAAFRNGLESGRLSSEALGAFERLVRAVRTTLIKGPIHYSGGSAGSRTFAYEKSLAPASRGSAAITGLCTGANCAAAVCGSRTQPFCSGPILSPGSVLQALPSVVSASLPPSPRQPRSSVTRRSPASSMAKAPACTAPGRAAACGTGISMLTTSFPGRSCTRTTSGTWFLQASPSTEASRTNWLTAISSTAGAMRSPRIGICLPQRSPIFSARRPSTP